MKYRLLWISLVLISGCKDTQLPELQSGSKVFHHGDPFNLIRSTQQNLQSFFEYDELDQLSGFSLQSQQLYPSYSHDQSFAIDESWHGQSSEHHSDYSEPVGYHFTTDWAHEIVWYEPDFADDTLPSLGFRLKPNGSMDLGWVNDRKVEVLHYSINSQKSLFSLLINYVDEDNPALQTFYFTKLFSRTKGKLLQQTDQEFSYLLGRHLAIGWQDSLTLKVCGEGIQSEIGKVEQALQGWGVPVSGLKVKLESTLNPKPFSDVNQVCVSLVDGYQMTDSGGTVLGRAAVVINPSLNQIVAANSIIFSDLHTCNNQHKVPIASTIVHEVGHLLGMGHEFKQNESGEAVHPSVMGYNHLESPTDWDRQAFIALYPPENSQGIPIVH